MIARPSIPTKLRMPLNPHDAPRALTLRTVLLLGALVCALGTPAARADQPAPGASTPVRVTLTTHNLHRALTRMPELRLTPGGWRGARTLDVRDGIRYQQMVGFGGAMTDSSAWLLYDQLTPRIRNEVMEDLFSAGGIHLNFVRVPIGASDFTATGVPYTYDDLPPGQTDPPLAHFSIAHDEAYIVPSLQQMLSIDPRVDILSSEWSPPAWMKANDDLSNPQELGTLLPADYEPLAIYFAKFIGAYQADGIRIWGITPQNEPQATTHYPGLALTPEDEAQFVTQNLAPTLHSLGLEPRIYGVDGSNLSDGVALEQDGAGPDLAGMAWHCYGGQQRMSEFHETYPDVNEIMSECSPGIIPYPASEVAISGTRNWGSAIALWNLALDPSGGPVEPPDGGCPRCTGIVTVSEASHTARFRRNYYELGQFSKFIARGATRIFTQRWVSDFVDSVTGRYGVTRGLDNVAFLNPNGSHVLVAYNNSPAPISFAVRYGRQGLKYRLPASATVTFVWG
jgi:glucosylceramidase